MQDIRLVVSDLDALLPRSGRIGKATMEVLSEIRYRGIHFSIATGRLFHHALPAIAELNLSDPIICCSGAVTRRVFGEEADRELVLPFEVCREVFAQLFFYADDIFLLGGDVIYASPEADETLVQPWGNRIVRYDPADELPDGLQAVLSFGRRDLLLQAAHLLEESLSEVEARFSGERFLGLVPLLVRPRGADKGAALADLRDRLGVSSAEVMVFGGRADDLPMFREAGRSVAPRNAHHSARRAATYVSRYTSEQEAVARELELAVL